MKKMALPSGAQTGARSPRLSDAGEKVSCRGDPPETGTIQIWLLAHLPLDP